MLDDGRVVDVSYTYDEMVGYTCDNKLYFFLKDAEGDVIGLIDSSNGNVVEKYSYDTYITKVDIHLHNIIQVLGRYCNEKIFNL